MYVYMYNVQKHLASQTTANHIAKSSSKNLVFTQDTLPSRLCSHNGTAGYR